MTTNASQIKRNALDVINTATEIANVTVNVLISLPDLATTPVSMKLIINLALIIIVVGALIDYKYHVRVIL